MVCLHQNTTVVGHDKYSVTEAQVFMNMIEVLKEEMNKSLKEIFENKQAVKEINKIAQNLKVEIESIKKTQTKINLELKHLGTQTGTSKRSLTNNKIKAMEESLRD